MPKLICLSIALACACHAPADEVSSQLTSQRALIRQGQLDQAQQMIDTWTRNNRVPASAKWHFVVDQASIQRLRGKPRRALQTLDRLPDVDRDRGWVGLERVRCLLADDEPDQAQDLLRLLLNSGDTAVRFMAEYEDAKLAFQHKQFDRCIEVCDRAVFTYRDIGFLAETDVRGPWEAEARNTLGMIQRLKTEAQAGRLAEIYGESYAHYYHGRIAQSRREYERAVEHFRRVDAPILVDAAGCYAAQCVAAVAEPHDAVAAYQRFIDADPDGLYRGEAMLRLGELQLTHARSSGELREALRTLTAARAWLKRMSRSNASADVNSIRAILSDFPVPKQFGHKDQFGVFHRKQVTPYAIINRLTSPWYLPRLEVENQLLTAAAHGELGSTDSVVAVLKDLRYFNRAGGDHLMDTDDLPDRLVWEAGDGAFLLLPEYWQALSAQTGRPIRIGFLYLVANEPGKARACFEDALRNTASDPALAFDHAAASLGLACVYFQAGSRDTALALLTRFETNFKDSPLAPYAIFLRANLLAAERGGFETAALDYTRTVQAAPGTTLAARAILAASVAAANHDEKEIAIKGCKQLVAQYKDTPYAEAGETLLRSLNQSPADAAKTARFSGASSPARSRSRRDVGGEIRSFQYHFVLPMSTDLTISLADAGVDDIINYEIAFSAQSGCRITGFSQRLTINEPQLPPVDESPLRHVRVPVLIR